MPLCSTCSTPSDTPTHVVGIGASAGGLIALEEFFKTVPAKTGLAYVVIQHLPADHKSMMLELLSRHTELEVHYIEDSMALKANSVYLIPPGYNVKLFHNAFLLSKPEEHQRQLNLPIDVFFSSLADDQEEKAIAIILSGTGSDGSRGIRHIKEKFGINIVQDLATAQFDGMPKSAMETGIVDFILPPEKMIHHILTYIQHPFAKQTPCQPRIIADETGLTRIFSILRENHMVDFTFYKQATVLRRIERRMTINQMHEIGDYIKYLESYPKEVTTLYNELLIGVTNFFRDPEAFDYLRSHIIPNILDQKENQEIRLWVEGCSTGEEAYSLGILCKECMEAMDISPTIKIFATDVDKRAIMRASDGFYPESISADLGANLLTKYFYRKNNHFQISRQIREMVVFAQHNILKDPPFTNIDLVSCRNLLIYLQPILQKRALEKFNFALNQDGVLFLGSSESVGDMNYYFNALNNKWKIYQSKGRRHQPLGGLERYVPDTFEKKKFFNPVTAPRPLLNEKTLERLLTLLTHRYADLTLLVNDDNEILHVLGKTELFLRFPSGKPMNDIQKVLIKALKVPVIAGLQKVFKDKEPAKYSNLRLRENDTTLTARMEIHPLEDRGDKQPLAVILIEGTQEPPEDENIHIEEIDIHVEKRIENLENELQFTRESLQTTIEELETSNEELGATNEELMASNEELQSTNEELQSVNQELYTVNAEYQGKNLELVEIKNDLENLLTNLEIPILFLDEKMEIRQFTPQLKRLFKIKDTDVGRPIDHTIHNFEDLDLIKLLKGVLKTEKAEEHEGRTQDGTYYLIRINPYRISKHYTAGVILVFIDITRQKKNEFMLRRLATVVMDSNDAVTVQDLEGNITAWNHGAERIYGYSESEALDMNIRALLPPDTDETDALSYITDLEKEQILPPYKTTRKTKEGDKVEIMLTATRLVDAMDHMVAIATTERKINTPNLK